MKLIDILVEELPKRGGCPEGANFIAQDEGRATWSFINKPAKDEDDEWMDDSETNYHKLLGHLPKASDYRTAIITREQYEAALAAKNDENDLNECIVQDAAPVWNGDGLPPVGCVCERSWAGDKWLQCEIIFTGNEIVLVKLATREAAYRLSDVIFRPIRSEADRKREKAIAKITDAICGEIPDTGMATAAKYAARAYDAIAAGKITGVKLED